MTQNGVDSNISNEQGILILTRKSSGYIFLNITQLGTNHTVQFDIKAPDGNLYNSVAIYAPDGDNVIHFKTINGKI